MASVLTIAACLAAMVSVHMITMSGMMSGMSGRSKGGLANPDTHGSR